MNRRRIEFAALSISLAALALLHVREVDWLRFATAFLVLDLAGYLPGAIAFRRAGRGAIAPVYHHLYNVTHSWLFAALGLGAWALAAGPEWAMLAVPIHLAGDRGFFGNDAKPACLPFEA